MGRVETLFGLVREHAAASARFPWIRKVGVQFCKLADKAHRLKWRNFAHTDHAVYTVCFAKVSESELTDEEILGIAAHELGHIVGIRLRYPEHARLNPPHWKKPVEEEANRIAREVLGFEGLRINRRTLQELSTIPITVIENPEPSFKEAYKAFPKFLQSYDPMGHKTVADLVFLAETEIDFYHEGQDTVDIQTPKQLRQVQEFIRKFKVKS